MGTKSWVQFTNMFLVWYNIIFLEFLNMFYLIQGHKSCEEKSGVEPSMKKVPVPSIKKCPHTLHEKVSQ